MVYAEYAGRRAHLAASEGGCCDLDDAVDWAGGGMVSGVMGIGGGILFVPALIWLAGMDQHKAQGTSLGALLLPVGIFAFLGVLPQWQRRLARGAAAGCRISGRWIFWGRRCATHSRTLAAAHLCPDAHCRWRTHVVQPVRLRCLRLPVFSITDTRIVPYPAL